MLILHTSETDIYRNLAAEEFLLERCEETALFLWRSECAVVLGKNQNPWRECLVREMQRDGIPFARRVSGGGTVYHDLGNLNYALFMPRNTYEPEKPYEVVRQALLPFGIGAEKTGQSNLSVSGRKFSGNAFAFKRNRVMHHGTLLINADLQRLGRYLKPTLSGIETHAIASVPATVCNLTEFVPELTAGSVGAALHATFLDLFADGSALTESDDSSLDQEFIEERTARHKTREWQFGHTPRFTARLADGSEVEVRHGVVEKVLSGSIDLTGQRFDTLAPTLKKQS